MPALGDVTELLPSRLQEYLDGSRLLFAVMERLVRKGSLTVIDSSGKMRLFGDGEGPSAAIRFHGPAIQLKLALYPGLYFGEGYMNGEWDVEDGDLKSVVGLLFMNLARDTNSSPPWFTAIDNIQALLRRLQRLNSAPESANQIEHHYDLGSPLYDLFLDPDRQYSCAYFGPEGKESLEEAQLRKKSLLRKKLLLESKHRVLDIGCGWGGLALYLARTTGAHVTGITLSKDQLDIARARAKEEDIEDLVDFQLLDYRSVRGSFDRIVSVGMFEHVGLGSYPEFFKHMQDLLSDSGIALLHSIARSTPPAATNPWIRRHIFPGGYLPSVSEVIPEVERSGLIMTDLEILRGHYAFTLRAWRERFLAHRKEVERLYGERFCRMWEFYLASSEASFEHSGLMVFQMQMLKTSSSFDRTTPVPITRDYIYREGERLHSLNQAASKVRIHEHVQ